jgi:hypothetical protein
MHDKHLYEYAVLRVVPRVEREEFINIGVILFCPSQGFLQVLYTLDENRLQSFSKDLDLPQLEAYLVAIDKVCKGRKEGGSIGNFSLSSRFRWLTATRSSSIQASKVHPGFCNDPQQKLIQLHQELVL